MNYTYPIMSWIMRQLFSTTAINCYVQFTWSNVSYFDFFRTQYQHHRIIRCPGPTRSSSYIVSVTVLPSTALRFYWTKFKNRNRLRIFRPCCLATKQTWNTDVRLASPKDTKLQWNIVVNITKCLQRTITSASVLHFSRFCEKPKQFFNKSQRWPNGERIPLHTFRESLVPCLVNPATRTARQTNVDPVSVPLTRCHRDEATRHDGQERCTAIMKGRTRCERKKMAVYRNIFIKCKLN